MNLGMLDNLNLVLHNMYHNYNDMEYNLIHKDCLCLNDHYIQLSMDKYFLIMFCFMLNHMRNSYHYQLLYMFYKWYHMPHKLQHCYYRFHLNNHRFD